MEDVIEGRWCMPRNSSADQEGTVHHHDTARLLGYEEGLVPAAVHLEQFPPLLVHHFGDDWWRHGTLSVYLVSMTIDHEPVCCYLEPAGPGRALVWMNAEGESLVMRGTASVGQDGRSEVTRRLRDRGPARALRILAEVAVDVPSEPIVMRISAADVDRRLAVTTEHLPCYRDATELGGRVVPLAGVVEAARRVGPMIAPLPQPCVALEGALEVGYVNGPVFCEHDYLLEGRVLALSEDTRAELLWYRADLYEADDRTPVAYVMRMDRLTKSTSPLWR